MPLLRRIREEVTLASAIQERCCDEGICIELDDKTPAADAVFINVDEFYRAHLAGKRPKSPDCLVVTRCKRHGFGLYLVELKSHRYSRHFDLTDIEAKFNACIHDFMASRFPALFNRSFNKIKLYVLTNDPFYRKDNLCLKRLQNIKFSVGNQRAQIALREPGYKIPACYGKE